MLDDDVIVEGLVKNDQEFVIYSLVLKSGLPVNVVERALNSRRAKVVVALAWKAGLSMRTALQLQMRGAKIPHTEFLNAKNGTDYPLSVGELQSQLRLITDFVASLSGEK